jgi:streptogramin lyase
VTPGGTISTLAGNTVAGYSGDNGPAALAQLNGPAGVAVDSAGNVYIADSGNHVVRMVTPAGIITTVAGNAFTATSGDGGPATSASLAIPADVAIDSHGNLYIVDASANRIRVVNSGGIINTIAGIGTPGYSGDNGPALNAQFNNSFEIKLDASGNLYVADRANNVIRVLQPVSATSAAASN